MRTGDFVQRQRHLLGWIPSLARLLVTVLEEMPFFYTMARSWILSSPFLSPSSGTTEPRNLSLSSGDESRQHLPATIDPSAQLSRCGSPVPLVDASTQCRRLQTSCPQVEREVDNGRNPTLRLGGQHRAVAQRRGKRRLQVARQIHLGLCLRDRRVLGIAEMTVTNRPEACGADIRRCPHEPAQTRGNCRQQTRKSPN
jgi:hypothetical protein